MIKNQPYIGVYCSRFPLTLLSVARCLRWALQRLFAVFRLLSLNSALGVKVGFRAAVFYGFPYKLRPKPKITISKPKYQLTSHTLAPLPIMCESCDKNVIMPLRGEWPAGRRQNRKQAEPEFFPLSDVGLVKGEILSLLTCTCMRVGKSRPPSVTEIWSQIATGCSCF